MFKWKKEQPRPREKGFPYRDMTLWEAHEIWDKAIANSTKQGPKSFIHAESELPPGGIIALAEAFALVYLSKEQNKELYDHFTMGLTLFGGNCPDYLYDLPEGIGRAAAESGIPRDRLSAYSCLTEEIAEVSRRAGHEWFQTRIGDAPRF